MLLINERTDPEQSKHRGKQRAFVDGPCLGGSGIFLVVVCGTYDDLKSLEDQGSHHTDLRSLSDSGQGFCRLAKLLLSGTSDAKQGDLVGVI